MVYSMAKDRYVRFWSFLSAIVVTLGSPNMYISLSTNPPQLKNKYFTSRLVDVMPFNCTLVRYNLNYFNALPVRNNPAYATWSIAIGNFTPSCVILKCICIRNLLSLNLSPANRSINSSLIFAAPILLTLSLSA